MKGLQPSTARLGERERRRNRPGSQGAARGGRGRDQRCLQPGDRQSAGQEESPGMPGIPQAPHHYPLPADTVSVFQVSE